MSSRRSRLGIYITSLLVVLLGAGVLVTPAWAASVNITVDSDTIIGTNEFSLGTQADLEWRTWRDSPALQQLTEDANFKLIRMFSHRSQPCTSWNEATKTGTWNWATVDSFVDKILAIGAQPEITMMYMRSGYTKGTPSGMAINPTTNLPYPDSYAAYARAWVKHFKDTGRQVKYYDLLNETPYHYWKRGGTVSYSKLSYYLSLFNRAYDAMHSENPNILVGSDAALDRPFLDYWIQYGGKLDFLAFHKYDGWAPSSVQSDATVLQMAETHYFVTRSYDYGVQDARQMWLNARGVRLPAMNLESNWAAYCSYNGQPQTDPRIQKVVGAVWTALMIRKCILSGVSYAIYFSFGSSKSWQVANTVAGFGFGMVNLDDDKPWYPYYVQKMIGTNLAVGDQIVETTSSSSDVRTLAWLHESKVNLLIISKVSELRYVQLDGLQGTLSYLKVDNAVSYLYPRVQTGSVEATATLALNGYTVILLQATSVSPPPAPSTQTILEDGFESGNFNSWTGTISTSGETSMVVGDMSHHGAYGAKFTSNGGGGTEQVYLFKTTQLSELYVRGYFRVASSGIADNDDRFHFISFRANGEGVAYAGWWQTGGLVKWSLLMRDGTSWVTAFSSTIPSLNEWYTAELHWVEDSANGRGELYVNGLLIASLEGKNTATFGSVDEVRFGLPNLYSCGLTTVFGDCFKIATTEIGIEAASTRGLTCVGNFPL